MRPHDLGKQSNDDSQPAVSFVDKRDSGHSHVVCFNGLLVWDSVSGVTG
jgi:hypothetical protein